MNNNIQHYITFAQQVQDEVWTNDFKMQLISYIAIIEGNTGVEAFIIRQQDIVKLFSGNSWLDCWDQGNINVLSIITIILSRR